MGQLGAAVPLHAMPVGQTWLQSRGSRLCVAESRKSPHLMPGKFLSLLIKMLLMTEEERAARGG